MKYIKTYESRKFRDQKERDLYNLTQRLERAISKFFDTKPISTKNIDWDNYDNMKSYNYVSYNYHALKEEEQPAEYDRFDELIQKSKPISFLFNTKNFDPNRVEAFKYEMDRLSVRHTIGFDLTIKQAEELLQDLKSGQVEKYWMEIDMKKYNI